MSSFFCHYISLPVAENKQTNSRRESKKKSNNDARGLFSPRSPMLLLLLHLLILVLRALSFSAPILQMNADFVF